MNTDIAYARKALTCLALELPGAVFSEIKTVFGTALDELQQHRETAVTESSTPMRQERQDKIFTWARAAFGEAQATSIPQRGLRLLEEALELFQACVGDAKKAHELVDYVFARPPGHIGQEIGGVSVTVLALAAAAGLSADTEERREVDRCLSRPVEWFTARNAAKNAAGFLMPEAVVVDHTSQWTQPETGDVITVEVKNTTTSSPPEEETNWTQEAGKWTASTDEENWNGSATFDTLEEAIDYGKFWLAEEYGLEDGALFYTGTIDPVTAEDLADHAFNTDRIIEDMEEGLCEMVGELAEDHPMGPKDADAAELEERLKCTLVEWMKEKNAVPKVCRINNDRSHVWHRCEDVDETQGGPSSTARCRRHQGHEGDHDFI